MLAALLTSLVLSQTPCPRGWSALPGDACLLEGEAEGLIVYFHGMMAPTPKTLDAAALKLSHPPV